MAPPEPSLPTATSRDVIITTSLEGRVVGWSRGAQALLGWREREIVGRPHAELLVEKHRRIDRQNVEEVRAGNAVRNTVVKHLRHDGVVLSCLQTLLPLRDATGRVVAARRIVFDLSSLQEAERALRRGLAQVREATADGELAAPPPARRAIAHGIEQERERTRDEYLRVIEGEAARLAGLLGELRAGAGAGRVRADRCGVQAGR